MNRLCIILCLILSGCVYTPLELMLPETISVYVSGAVVNDVHLQLPLFSTIEDVLHRVVLMEDADISGLNPATTLKHQDVIRIPFLQETPCVSINFASEKQLEELKGIGPAMAKRIIDYRDIHGLFPTIQSLTHIKGIGDKMLAKIIHQICL